MRWKEIDGWHIAVDRTIGDGCFATTIYEGGTVLRIGFNRIEEHAYIVVGNDDWKSIEVGKQYDMSVRFDRETPWEARFFGLDLDGTPLLHAVFTESEFAREFMQSHGVVMDFDGRTVANLSLDGSFRAFAELAECQREIDGARASAGDPFAGAASPASADPFAH